MHQLTPIFTFAGFTFPRYVATLPRGPFSARKEARKNPVTGGYYHQPKPITKGRHPGRGFYLNDAGQPTDRWQWADKVIRLNHRGWFCDEYQDQTIRGLVFRLPHGRGFLAGWSMGEGMISSVDGFIHDTEEEAAYSADSMAESAAEAEREYQAREEQEAA